MSIKIKIYIRIPLKSLKVKIYLHTQIEETGVNAEVNQFLAHFFLEFIENYLLDFCTNIFLIYYRKKLFFFILGEVRNESNI